MKSFSLKMLAALAATGVFQSAFALPHLDRVVKESINAPSGWIRKSVAPDIHVIPLRFALKQRDIETLETRLLKTSDPNHAMYGQHLSRDEVSSYLRPHEDTVTAVENWLQRNGVQVDEKTAQRSHAGDYFTVHVPVSKARSLLGADFDVFQHHDSGTHLVRTQQYSLPHELDQHIDYIGPLTMFSETKTQPHKVKTSTLTQHDAAIATRQTHNNTDICNRPALVYCQTTKSEGKREICIINIVTSQCLRNFYETEGYQPQAANRQLVGISGFTGPSDEVANRKDFKEFLRNENRQAYQAGYDFNVDVINGGDNNQNVSGVEAALDVQTVGGIIYPIPFTYYPVGGLAPYVADAVSSIDILEPYEKELSYFLGLSDELLPKVVSSSYGNDEQAFPIAYAKRVYNQIMALGARGVSLLYGSGDTGVGANGTCVSNGFYSKSGTPSFLAEFPASCPYATLVGATQGFSPEVVAAKPNSSFTSGGGFSNLFPTPYYQKSAVESYIQSLGDTFQGLYNNTGRGYPDLTASGSYFTIRLNGKLMFASGTSASTPLVASIVGLLNDARLAKGKPSLGFLNPLLYSKLLGTDGFNQITNRSAIGCQGKGFPAQKGWNAVAGIGSPRFKKIVKTCRLGRTMNVVYVYVCRYYFHWFIRHMLTS